MDRRSAAESLVKDLGDIDGARRALSRVRLGWLGQRAIDALPLLQVADLEVLVTCEGGDDANWLSQRFGARLVALEQNEPVRRLWSNASLGMLANLDWADKSDRQTAPPEDINLVAYCATPEWETHANKPGSGIRLLAPSASLKQRLDDKRLFRACTAYLGLPTIPSEQVGHHMLSFDHLAKRYGVPFVAQWPVSSAGQGTFIIQTRSDLAEAVESDPIQMIWLISKYMGATTFNVNALSLPDRTWVAPPSVQLVGIPQLANGAAVYCGNDYAAVGAHPPSVRAQLTAQTRTVGNWLAKEGFVGAFGVDYVLEHDVVYPLELNPRFQGSTGLLGQWESYQGRISLSALHTLTQLGYSLGLPSDYSDGNHLAFGSQAIIHSQHPTTSQWLAPVPSGIYSLGADGIATILRAGQSVADCLHREFVITGVPPRGAAIEPGATILRVMARDSLAQPGGNELTDWGIAVLSSVQRLVDSGVAIRK